MAIGRRAVNLGPQSAWYICNSLLGQFVGPPADLDGMTVSRSVGSLVGLVPNMALIRPVGPSVGRGPAFCITPQSVCGLWGPVGLGYSRSVWAPQ